MFSAFIVIRILYDLAMDKFNKGAPSKTHPSLSPSTSLNDSGNRKNSETSGESKPRKSVPTLNLTPVAPEPVIVHPGIVTTLLKLLPGIFFEDVPEVSIALQLFVIETIKGLLRSEKNQQIMCDVNFVSDMLNISKSVLEDEAHILHLSFQYILERLASHKLEPQNLRTVLRLGNPLACLSDDERQNLYTETPANQKPGSFIPLTRIKTMVSMTTPKDLHVQNNSIMPPFIELDMSSEGFGCIFLPSLAPYNPNSSSVVGVSALASQDGNVIGGIGQGDRAFPPHPGLSFSTWFCIDKFSDPRSDPHPVRLLTIARQQKGSQQQEDKEVFACLSICLSARDKAIIVSTQESKQK